MKSRKSVIIVLVIICIIVFIFSAVAIDNAMKTDDAAYLVKSNFGLEDASLPGIKTIIGNLYGTGYFDTREDAARAYIAARLNLEASDPESEAVKLAIFANDYGYYDFEAAAIFIRNQAHDLKITNEDYLNQRISD
jgi:hypothetical protein